MEPEVSMRKRIMAISGHGMIPGVAPRVGVLVGKRREDVQGEMYFERIHAEKKCRSVTCTHFPRKDMG